MEKRTAHGGANAVFAEATKRTMPKTQLAVTFLLRLTLALVHRAPLVCATIKAL